MQGKYRCIVALASGVLLAFGTGSAVAAAPGFYLGGSVGSSFVQDEDQIDLGDRIESFHIDDNDFAWKGYAGIDILPWLGVEGGYVDFGNVDESRSTVRVKSSLDGWDAFAVGTIPIAFVDLFAKVGIISYNLDVNLDTDRGQDHVSSSNEDIAYGVGAAFNFGKLAVRAEAERFDVSDVDDLYLLSAGITWRF